MPKKATKEEIMQDKASEEAYIWVCENEGYNSPEFDRLWEEKTEALMEEYEAAEEEEKSLPVITTTQMRWNKVYHLMMMEELMKRLSKENEYSCQICLDTGSKQIPCDSCGRGKGK